MNGEEDLRYQGIKAFVRLREWAIGHCDEAAGPAVALQGVSVWFMNAARGRPTISGPWALLYWKTADIVWFEKGNTAPAMPFEIANSVPTPTSEQVAVMSRLYSVVYMLALYGEWSDDDVTDIAAAIGTLSFDRMITVRLMIKELMDGKAGLPLRRAVDALNEHRCVGDDRCALSSVLWENEDQKSAQWLDARING